MSSIRAKIIDLGFRALMLRKLDTPEKFVAHSRLLINLVRPPALLPTGVRIRKTTIANLPAVPPGIPSYCISTENPSATVLYLHGGAFVCGKFPTYAGLCGQLAKRLNARVYWPDYRMAPEMPFPAATDDAFNAYSALASDYPDDPLAIIGDSAGGNLTLSTLLRLRDTLAADQHEPSLRMPSCAVGLSPAADLAATTPSREANARQDCVLTPQIIQYAADLYLNGHDPSDPYASPVHGDFHGLPPLMLTVSEGETLRDDVYRVAHRARRDRVPVKILSRWDAPHAWPVLYHLLPEAKADIAEVIRFMRQHLDSATGNGRSRPPLRLARAS